MPAGHVRAGGGGPGGAGGVRDGREAPGTGPVRLALAGCGSVARMHVAAYAAHPGRVRVVAACDPDLAQARALQQQYGIDGICGSVGELAGREDWDVAVVCTPTPVHRATVEELAAAARPVFVEKPLADGYVDAERIVEACERAGVSLAVNQNFRYHYPFELARGIIRDGAIGDVVTVAHQDLFLRQDRGWRLGERRHALSVMGVHWLDGFRRMLDDEARTVSCQVASSPLIDCAGETDAVVQAGFARGAMVSYVQSFSCPYRRTETVVVGTRGTLELSYDGAVEIDPDGQARRRWDNPYRGANKPEATFETMSLLLAAIEGGGEASNSGRDNLRTIALLDAAYRSAEEGRPVAPGEGTPA